MPRPLIERRLQLAGLLIVLGLVIQMVTFVWLHPLAFMTFLLIGCPLVAAGILLYLYSLVSSQPSESDARNESQSNHA
jgi:uncharacterized membrane protein YczE